MTTKFIVGAFVVLVLISLVIVGILRGFNFGQPKTTTNPNRVNLPVVSNEVVTTPNPDSVTNNPATGLKTHTNSELGLTFSYPNQYAVAEQKVSPNNYFPYVGYEFTLGTGSFGVFMAPHQTGRGLTDILNGQNAIAQENGDTPAQFTTVNKFGNSFETAKFTAGSPSLYAVRTTNNVYYVYLVNGGGEVASQIETIANSFQFTDTAQTR